jgi:hypothetical protein
MSECGEAGRAVRAVTDLLAEHTMGFAAAARQLPRLRGGRPVHPSTLTRWATAGISAADGRVVRLEAVRVASRWVTSSEALSRFIADLTAAPGVELVRTPAARRRASEDAARELARKGA